MSKALTITGLLCILFVNSASMAFAQDEESFVRRSTLSKRDAVVLSALFPGLGQMGAGNKVKGVTLFLAEAASLALFVNAHEDYSTKLTEYEDDQDAYKLIPAKGRGTYAEAQEMYNDLKDQSNELDDLNTIRNTALIVAAGVYAYNIFDILVFSPSDESRRAENSNRIKVSSTMVDRTPGILLTKRF